MKTEMPYEEALKIAQSFINRVAHACERVEIAGSLRRKKPVIGDIEVVCIPKFQQVAGLFEPQPVNMLEELFKNFPAMVIAGKERQKKIDLGNIQVDLFITTPEQWGVIYAIRTGCSDFSKWLVTHRQQGGGCPGYITVKDGRLWVRGEPLETPEERDVFDALNLPWIDPEKRTVGGWGK